MKDRMPRLENCEDHGLRTQSLSMDDSFWNTHTLARDGNVEKLQAHEWLLTNGTGAFSSGTASGCNTRRYHGLFVGALRPPVGRVLVLNQMLEQLELFCQPGAAEPRTRVRQTLDFSTLLFRDQKDGSPVYEPSGHRMLRRFDRGLSVVWIFEWGELRWTRQLQLHWKQQAATICYRIQGLNQLSTPGSAGSGQAILRLSPMLTLRDFHGLIGSSGAGVFRVRDLGDRLEVRRGNINAVLTCPGAVFTRNEQWWHNIWYPLETERGLDDHEDYFVPGSFEVPLASDGTAEATLSIALGQESSEACCDTVERSRHLRSIIKKIPITNRPQPSSHTEVERIQRCLAIAADDFVVDRGAFATIVAGYPWFADWGRDTFISLPGLLLCTDRFEEAQAVLKAFAHSIRNGLIPNRFDDYDDRAAHYNTVDASLWFVHAALEYLRITKHHNTWETWLGPAVLQIIEAYIAGTDYGIKMDDDGLVLAGSHSTQLTWMDAKCGNQVFTPRHGKSVEINALWYNALATMVGYEDLLTKSQRVRFDEIKLRTRSSFERLFWNRDQSCLFDHLWTDDQGKRHTDKSIRPNQIFAVSFAHSPLPQSKQTQVVQTVRSRLLTPFGLRTLPLDDKNYHGYYRGDQNRRDRAYHQGTVWPWLIGPFAESVLRVGKFSDEARSEARSVISPLLSQLSNATAAPSSVGQLHEIYEGESPHRSVGCIAQAWSVAEVIRALTLIESTSDTRHSE